MPMAWGAPSHFIDYNNNRYLFRSIFPRLVFSAPYRRRLLLRVRASHLGRFSRTWPCLVTIHASANASFIGLRPITWSNVLRLFVDIYRGTQSDERDFETKSAGRRPVWYSILIYYWWDLYQRSTRRHSPALEKAAVIPYLLMIITPCRLNADYASQFPRRLYYALKCLLMPPPTSNTATTLL